MADRERQAVVAATARQGDRSSSAPGVADKLLFITDRRYVDYQVKGGVQVCTAEYMALLRAAGFDLLVHPIDHTHSLRVRLKLKFGLGAYDRYDCEALLPALLERLKSEHIRYVAINQVNLAGFALLLKAQLGDKVQVLVLSHGNESGDVLHEIVRQRSMRGLARGRDAGRLGSLLLHEADLYSNAADCVLCLSETEQEINRWLGAAKTLFVPRTFTPAFLEYHPRLDRIGFVGTLDHLPNREGLLMFLHAFEKINVREVKLRIVGAPASAGKWFERSFSCVEYAGILGDDDLAQEAATWACCLNPVFWYARGASTKLAKPIEWGIPVVSTVPGNRGYVWRDGHVPVADDAASMAAIVRDLTQSIEEVERCAAESRRVAHSGPTLQELAQSVNDVLGRN